MENNIMEKINVAELLKDCPKGMELDCTIFNGKVYFEGIDDNNSAYPIKISVNLVNIEHLDIYGQYNTRDYAKCVIFPKGKTTWEGFQRHFKDGDILTTNMGSIFIFSHLELDRIDDRNICRAYVGIRNTMPISLFHTEETDIFGPYESLCKFATEEEKEKLFDAIKDNGYKWNEETKTLEWLPKFKVGDRVKVPYEDGRITGNELYEYKILKIKWDDLESTIKYGLPTGDEQRIEYYSTDNLNIWNKKETMEEIIKIDIPKGYEFAGVDDDNQQVIFEKIGYQYPKTYEECCDVLKATHVEWFGYYGEVLIPLQKLIICRDAYCKLAGEQMGLDEPWEPDWDDDEQFKYVIIRGRNCVIRDTFTAKNVILALPTEEMRDAFYENFKDLIEQCKELL